MVKKGGKWDSGIREGSIVEIDFKTTVWHLIYKIAMDRSQGDLAQYARGVEMLQDIMEMDRKDKEYNDEIEGLNEKRQYLIKRSQGRAGTSMGMGKIDAYIAREKFRIIMRQLKRNNIGPPKEIIEPI